ncbi:5-methylcytosine rRNA methyltransferase NSUN4-like [Penaeus japonicus]|uniref:5-methylcytosine rRNA methyltransferase NSUN4-like n=1 Tax=Penaeus japonicus TaxID=27405 RepID=UPI001C714466|nr:5-methylcytosine rRNA methyltransferase NSUN4-like [Penaeus japonicus]
MIGLAATRNQILIRNSVSFNILKRHKKKSREPKVTNSQRALEYFDIAYAPVYGTRWPSIRLALLSKPKYMAVLNNFASYDETIERFQNLGAWDIREKYSAIRERMRQRREQSQATSEDRDEDTDETSVRSNSVRPSLVELDDDELAARARLEPEGRYPEEYRLRAAAQNVDATGLEVDLASRVIAPSETGGSSLMMDYVPATRLKGLENWMEEADVFPDASQGDQDIGVTVVKQEEPIDLPKMLKIFAFEKGNISDFPQPRFDPQLRVLDHYAMDGASLLPVLALDVKPGDRVLDMCAAPGGKSLLVLQTLMPGLLVSNDVSEGRVKRIRSILKQFVPKGMSTIENLTVVTQNDGCRLGEAEEYDKILVDVPCLTDRHSLMDDDNSLFKTSRTKERLKLPELQSQLLVSALQALRPGGTVVYSTCTLSPLQNDGVVHLALSRIWQETTIECSVVDMSQAVRPLSFLYRFGGNLGLRYGQLILPSLLSNFGPMYCAKIKRIR